MDFPVNFIAAGYDYTDLEHFVPAPLFRKKFTANKTAKAEIVIGAAGFYKLFLNGRDITKGELAPYISNPDHIVYYDSYDVTELVAEGENVVAVLLGNGFQNNPGGYVWGFDKAPWRGAPKFAMKLALTAEDETVTEIDSDESFKFCESPILFDDLRCGEYYDAAVRPEAVHLGQQGIESVLSFVVSAHGRVLASGTSYGINLVDEDDARGFLFCLSEQVAHTTCTHADEHFNEVGAAHREERHAGLSCNGLSQQRLSGSRRADKQRSLGDFAAKVGVFFRVFQELYNLLHFLFGPGLTCNVLERYVNVSPFLVHLGFALADVEHAARAAPASAHASPKVYPQEEKQQDGAKTK